MSMKKVLIINGPNLNMLGLREPEVYGACTLEDIEALCRETAKDVALDVLFEQYNAEGEIVTRLQELRGVIDGVIINAAAYTHTSVAIRDALLVCGVPIIEVHISNVYKREDFRHKSYISDIAEGVICGLKQHGYVAALYAMKHEFLA